ncbi:hypothetical protein G7046_g1022 [Stylonectria norvegica]|nr:hypothetical protein G7046_g1022 [Stylonectria norvegica]
MDLPRRISTLLSWANKHDARLHPSIEIYQDPQTGLSFRVKQNAASTKSFEPIVSLPTTLILSYLNVVGQSDTSSFPQTFLAQSPPHVVGRFFLIQQYLLGEKSFWWPYIQALPQPNHYETWALAPFWPSDEAELLEGTNVEVGVEKIRGDVKTEYKAAVKLLFDWDQTLLQQLSLKLYQWAYCIFSSRSFRPSLVLSQEEQDTLPVGVGIDDFSVLLPLFDIGNHDMTTEINWELDKGGKNCELKVAKEYHPGEQVFNNYSMKTNAELLLGYGFMLPEMDQLHNDYIHVRKRQSTPAASEEYYISLRPINHPSSLLGRSKQALQLSSSTKLIGAFQHVQSDMVWDIFCTLAPAEQQSQLIPIDNNLQGAAAEQARQDNFFSGHVSEEGQEYLQQTAAIIQHKVMQELDRLEETDVEVVGGGDLTANQKLALDYRARCRRVLENTLEAMSTDELFG